MLAGASGRKQVMGQSFTESCTCICCSSVPDAPVIVETVAEANFPGNDNVLYVFLTPPAYNGSGKELPFAEGKLVKYKVTAESEDAPTIMVEGEGEVKADGTVRSCSWPLDCTCFACGLALTANSASVNLCFPACLSAGRAQVWQP